MSDFDEERRQAGRRLFEHSVESDAYPGGRYQDHLLEQYKLYVEMADRISNRRGVANAFFATLNTALLSGVVGFAQHIDDRAFMIPLAGIVVCVVWGVLLRSYRNLSTAKFLVIGLLEERLPASPYWHAEWHALGEDKDWRKHIPLGPIEIWVPVAFALLYVTLVVQLL